MLLSGLSAPYGLAFYPPGTPAATHLYIGCTTAVYRVALDPAAGHPVVTGAPQLARDDYSDTITRFPQCLGASAVLIAMHCASSENLLHHQLTPLETAPESDAGASRCIFRDTHPLLNIINALDRKSVV